MILIKALILGIVQGLTEFIPVSSSGHLVLFDRLLGFKEAGLIFDVALHGGTLLALIIFFHRDIYELIRSLFIKSPQTRTARYLAAATVPAIISGLLLQDYVETVLRSPIIIAVNLIVIAILMIVAERSLREVKKPLHIKDISLRQALTVGCAQALAIIPGVSRSGSTITAGVFLGFDRVAATRFSFLLGIPIMVGALAKTLLSGEGMTQIGDKPGLFIVGVIASLLSGLVAIRFLIGYLSKHSLNIFAYYRIVVGIIVLIAVLL